MREADIDAYFKRIGFAAAASDDLGTLQALHRLHPLAIPFENLSTLLREPIPLDTPALLAKLVARRRGGYCFEHNQLFADVLRTLGFDVTALAARVVWGRVSESLGPRTHMVLRVRVGTEDYLSDVGFGGLTLTGPLRFRLDDEQSTPHESFRFVHRDGELEIEALIGGEWRPLYRFDLQEQLPIDFEVLNHFVATHPSSHFLTTLVAARRTTDGRYALKNNELAVYRGASKEERTLGSAAEIGRVLAETFGIELPHGPALEALLGSIATQ